MEKQTVITMCETCEHYLNTVPPLPCPVWPEGCPCCVPAGDMREVPAPSLECRLLALWDEYLEATREMRTKEITTIGRGTERLTFKGDMEGLMAFLKGRQLRN